MFRMIITSLVMSIMLIGVIMVDTAEACPHQRRGNCAHCINALEEARHRRSMEKMALRAEIQGNNEVRRQDMAEQRARNNAERNFYYGNARDTNRMLNNTLRDLGRVGNALIWNHNIRR